MSGLTGEVVSLRSSVSPSTETEAHLGGLGKLIRRRLAYMQSLEASHGSQLRERRSKAPVQEQRSRGE